MKLMKYFMALLLIAAMGCSNEFIDDLSEDNLYPEDSIAIVDSSYSTGKEKTVFDKASNAEVTSPVEVNNVIPTNATFDIKFDSDVTTEYVDNTFSIKPYRELKIEKVSPKYYKLTVVNDLLEDQIYNIEEKTKEGTKKWAFQTEKVFKVEYAYPSNNDYLTETGVPEIRFNNEIDSSIKLSDYILIEPKISGNWKKSYSYNYRYEHDKHFELDKTYTITVKKGLKDREGNELKEDYVTKFIVQNEKDVYGYLELLNCYKPNEKIDMNLYYGFNMDKGLSINTAYVKVLNLGSKEEFIKAINDINYKENISKYDDKAEYKEVFKQDIKEVLRSKYEQAKAEEMYYYYEEMLLDNNLIIDEEGYYLAVVNINGEVSFGLFQVNKSSGTCSVLSSNNLMILYKGSNGQNNSVDVYVNKEKLGTTDNDGLLYVESFKNKIKNINKDVNYVEFMNDGAHLICDVSNSVSYIQNGENSLTNNSRYNNGYIYVDRNYYKNGETINYWGYAKNRNTKVENARLVITANYDDILQDIPLKLSDAGTFDGSFEITDVNDESSISLNLYIGDNIINSRYVTVRNYELKQYNIEIKPEATSYLDGENAAINISAETYDGTPLDNLEFKYEINNKYYYNDGFKAQSGSVKTDEYGFATINVPLVISKAKTNIMPENVRVTVLNSYIDGEQESLNFIVYPYKNYANGSSKFIVDENKYYLSFEEYKSLDKDTPANDSIKVIAKAYKTVKINLGTRYNKYTKEMEDQFEYREEAVPSNNKTFTVNVNGGKGTLEVPNYSNDKNCYYRFYGYLITDTGKELALSYNGEIYSGRYKTINSTTEYEDVEYVDPIFNQEITYTLRYETNDKLKVGDEVYFYLQDDNGRRINDYSKFEFYTLVSSAKGNEIIINKGERPHFTFTKDMGANCSTYTICYDSIKTYSLSSGNRLYYSYGYSYDFSYSYYPNSEIRLCEDELSLKLDVQFDKKTYEPKDEIEITIRVTDEGKGVKAGVNLSALDTAYIDANGETSTNIINSLYNNYYIGSSSNNVKSTTRMATNGASAKSMSYDSAMVEEAAMAPDAMAGGGEAGAERSDLRTTAFFESLVTDDNGYAKIKIKLPDNITEWTIKTQAISNGFKAKVEESKIKVSKDFFVSVNHKDRYLTGEHFAFNVKSFSKVHSGKNATIKIEILNASNKVLESKTVNTKAQEVFSYKLDNPIEQIGTYKIKITGPCEGLQDILIDEIQVTDSLLDATIREDLVLSIGDKVAIVSPKGYIYILNKDVAKILPTLFELSFMYNSERNDTTLISEEARRILNNLVSEKEFQYGYKSVYDSNKNIFKVMSNSSDDARLALRMLSTKAWLITKDTNEVLDKIEVRLGNMARLWAKVNLKKASLKELRNAKNDVLNNSSNYTISDVLYLSLAFADIGASDEATELYNIVKNQINESNENEFELKLTYAIKTNDQEAEYLYNRYIANENLLPENVDFIKLFYVQNSLDKNFEKGVLTLSVNGQNEEVQVNNVGLTRKLISRSDDIKVVNMTDNLKFMIEQYKPVNFAEVPKKNYILSKTYNFKDAKEGDMVEVTIVLDNVKLYNDGYVSGFLIEDAIPNNLTFVEYLYGTGLRGYLRKQDGQKLTINAWNPYDPKWNPSATKTTLKYKARVTNSGEQYEPGTILVKYNNMIIDGIK